VVRTPPAEDCTNGVDDDFDARRLRRLRLRRLARVLPPPTPENCSNGSTTTATGSSTALIWIHRVPPC